MTKAISPGEDPRASGPRLLIVADDYGLAPAYDAGIVAAARAGAIDAAGAMVLRRPNPGPLLETVVEVGLHLELDRGSLEHQLDLFERDFGRPPAYIDGHHHGHAEQGPAALAVARLGARLQLPVRSVSSRHRRLLRCLGVPTADRLVGRLDQDEPALPAVLRDWLGGGGAPAGATEWMVHPGDPDPGSGSAYDRGRGEDLALLLELGDRDRWRRRGIERGGPAEVLNPG